MQDWIQTWGWECKRHGNARMRHEGANSNSKYDDMLMRKWHNMAIFICYMTWQYFELWHEMENGMTVRMQHNMAKLELDEGNCVSKLLTSLPQLNFITFCKARIHKVNLLWKRKSRKSIILCGSFTACQIPGASAPTCRMIHRNSNEVAGLYMEFASIHSFIF